MATSVPHGNLWLRVSVVFVCGSSVVSDAELLNNSMPSPLPGTNTEEQDGVGSDDEDRNELFAILQEASSDEQDDGDTQEEDDNEVNVDVELEEESQFPGDKLC